MELALMGQICQPSKNGCWKRAQGSIRLCPLLNSSWSYSPQTGTTIRTILLSSGTHPWETLQMGLAGVTPMAVPILPWECRGFCVAGHCCHALLPFWRAKDSSHVSKLSGMQAREEWRTGQAWFCFFAKKRRQFAWRVSAWAVEQALAVLNSQLCYCLLGGKKYI